MKTLKIGNRELWLAVGRTPPESTLRRAFGFKRAGSLHVLRVWNTTFCFDSDYPMNATYWRRVKAEWEAES